MSGLRERLLELDVWQQETGRHKAEGSLADAKATAKTARGLRDALVADFDPPDGDLKIRPQLAAFSQDMERLLRANDHKGGWQDDSMISLMGRLEEETAELSVAIDSDRGERPQRIVDEAADVANFAMMIADVARLEEADQ